MKTENNIIDLRGVMDYLFNLKRHLKEEFGDLLTEIYAHGSLINNDGRSFKLVYSDVDLIVTTTPLTDIHERINFLIKLKDSMQRIEEDLKFHFKKRRFFPIISLCIVTEFELNDGIHKNRNSLDAFYNWSFRSLDSLNSSSVRIGGRLKEDLVGIHFPAWAILTEVQEVRSAFVTPKSSVKEIEMGKKGFNHKFLPLPKDMLRNAYIFDHYKRNEDDRMSVEDDIAEGFDVIKKMLKGVPEKDEFAKELYKLIVTNGTWGQNPGMPISSRQLLYLWELLSIETEKAIGEHRRGLDKESLEFAAPAVITELSRLRKTSLKSVDTAISLYQSDDLVKDGMLPVEVKPHQAIDQYEFTSFDKEKLISLADEWPEDIRDYFLNLLKINVKEVHNCQSKVGFAGIFFSHIGMALETGIPRQAYLSVRPLNYWILQQFNLAMAADPGNQELLNFREKYGRELFKRIQDYQCICPSGLYVEAAVVTKEGKVTTIPKLAAHSPLVQGRGGSSILTCGFEHGLSWNTDIIRKGDSAWLNVEQGLMKGLQKEFLIKPDEVKSWKISTLAIHHAHLNAALLGVVHLKISSGKLLDRFEKSGNEHFKAKELKFLSRDDAKVAMQKDKGSGKWHQTALMRINLIK